MDARAVYPIYEATYDEIRTAAHRGDHRRVAAICQRVRGFPDEERIAAMLAVEHMVARAPKSAFDDFARELGRRCT